MKAWIAFQKRESEHLIAKPRGFGDWLAIDIAENNPGLTPTPRDLIGTAYFIYTTDIVAQTASLLGKKKAAKKYRDLADAIRKAFVNEFVSANGRIAGDSQTSYLLALAFDALPRKMRKVFAYLVDRIESREVQLTTGFVGTPLLAPVLRFGRIDLAYALLLRREYPSWLYTVDQGATTMWERWNSYTKKDGFGNVEMNSFNHYAYGAIGEWLYASVAGIDLDPLKPGFKHTIFRPQPGEGIHSVHAELETRYGRVTSNWTCSQGCI